MDSQSRSQRRARHAFECVNDVLERTRDNPRVRERYLSYIRRLGPMIIMCGLGQAVAAELAASGRKGGEAEAHRMVYDNLSRWLCQGVGSSDLIEYLLLSDQQTYLKLQAEALLWLEWHKKFCEAYLGTKTQG